MSETLILIDTDTHLESGEARLEGQDVWFPEGIAGWTDVLDCRHPPYTEQSIEELCEFAEHVRKPYILVEPSMVESDDADEAA